ncbi:MAG: cupin domain-containing protein [Actinomycetota bacterium]
MSDEPISIPDAIAKLPGPLQPQDLAFANDAVVRVARIEGDVPWHRHAGDELFLCWDGEFRIEMKGRDPIQLTAGTLFVVPRGVEHRPVADPVAHALLIERPETKQYGD